MNTLLNKIITRWDIALLIAFVIIYSVSLSYLSIIRHDAFASNYDLGNMDQTLWTTLYGSFFTMSTEWGNITRLATHADFILILLAPIYVIWDNVRMLLITQSVLLALGALPVYFISRKILSNRIISIILALVYLLNPGLQNANLYDFHGVTVAIPALLAVFYFGITKKWPLYWLFFCVAIITKEEVSLVLAIMGMLFAVYFKEWKIGLVSLLFGIAWFIIMVFYVIPELSPTNQHWAFERWFAGPKNDIDSFNVFSLANRIWTELTSEGSLNYYPLILWPFAFLPLLGFPWVLLSLPDLVINTISTGKGMKTIDYHYQSTIIAGFMIASVFSLSYIDMAARKFRLFKPKLINIFIAIAVLITAIWFNYRNGILAFAKVNIEDEEFEKIIQNLPKKAIISASGEIRPHLTHRQNAFNIPTIPENVEYVALIDEDRFTKIYKPHDLEIALIDKLKKDANFKLIYQKNHYYLFQKLI